MNPRDHILSIRHKYTGENSGINAHGKLVIDNLTEVLTDTISELAQNIYKKDSHFIMELIQNADDNEYKNNIVPALKIIHDLNKITFQNNELGFTPKNVETICNIKKSTKSIKDGIKGYIGEKGIGFKSVFRVCNEPEIYSNGYQFKFNSNTNLRRKRKEIKLGYILPEWIENVTETVKRTQTNIILPYKDSLTKEERSRIGDIKPDLLLFLNKLRRLDIDNLNENKRIIVEKSQDGSISTLKQTTYYFDKVVNQIKNIFFIIDRDNVRVPHKVWGKQRKGVNNTRIILAFPLDAKLNFLSEEDQYLYSYLPITFEGFRFIIQADFILTSGREGIDEDNVWNQWIRNEIAETFKQAIDEFKKHPKYKYNFLQFVPRQDDTIADFWEPLKSTIIEFCRNSKVVLSETNTWRKPSEILTAGSKERFLFDNALLISTFKKEYLKVSSFSDDALDSTLGIKSFTDEDMYNCLDNYQVIRRKDLQWYFDFFAFISRRDDVSDIIERLSEIRIIPIQRNHSKNQSLVISKDNNIFLPLGYGKAYSFEKFINVISNDLYQKIQISRNKVVRRRIFDLFEEMGIRKPSAYFIIKNYILKKYENEEWKSRKQNELIDHLRYIKNHWIDLKANHDEIIKWFNDKPIIRCQETEDGKQYYSIPDGIYISKHYGNKNRLEYLFAGIEHIWFINDIYLNTESLRTKSKEKRKQKSLDWYLFFKSIGCNEIPVPEKDNSCKDFIKVIESSPEKNGLLLKLIGANWNFYKNRLYINKYTKSNWFKKLSEEKVIPVGNNLYYSKEIFLNTKKNISYFGKIVKYFPIPINFEFASKLGFNSGINSYSIVNYLKEVSRQNRRLKKENAYKLYKHLMNDENAELDDFEENKLIYLPETGKWYSINEVFWTDCRILLGQVYGYCEKSYSHALKEFFVERIGVRESPEVTTYLNVLYEFHKKSNGTDLIESEKRKIHRLYVEIGSFPLDSKTDEKLLSELRKTIWTNKGSFWTNDGNVFYNDNNELFELFKNEDSVAFFDIPKEYIPKAKKLLSLLEIKPVSEAISTDYFGSEGAFEDKKMTEKVRLYAKTIISVLYTDHLSHFEEYNGSTIFRNLENIEIFESPELELECSLNNVRRTLIGNSFHKGERVYINREDRDKVYTLATEISKLLKLPQIFDFILILLTSNKSTINYYLKHKNITPPPDEMTAEQPEQKADLAIEHIKESSEKEGLQDDVDEDQEEEAVPQSKPPILKSILMKRWKPEVGIEESSPKIEFFSGSEEELKSEEGRSFDRSSSIGSTGQTHSRTTRSQDDLDEIGKYGEHKTYFELIRQLKHKYHKNIVKEDKKNQIFRIYHAGVVIVELKWLNFKDKVQEGYDLILTESGCKKYYEVKTTTGDESIVFGVSAQQWRFIKDKAGKYSIIRVINAGTKNIRLIEINNPYQLWKEGKLKAYPVNIELS